MNVLELYLINGMNVLQIAAQTRMLEPEIREHLRVLGVVVPSSELDDPVVSAAKRSGFKSFAEFIRNTQQLSHSDKARVIGVTRSGFTKLYDIYRGFVSSQSAGGGRA